MSDKRVRMVIEFAIDEDALREHGLEAEDVIDNIRVRQDDVCDGLDIMTDIPGLDPTADFFILGGDCVSIELIDDKAKEDPVVTVCYGKEKSWENREDAVRFFLEGMTFSEGSERDRYAKIYTELKEGKPRCTDGSEPAPVNKQIFTRDNALELLSKSDGKNVTIPSGYTTIGFAAFAMCDTLESVVIPASVTTIERAAFARCSNLKCIDLPSTVTHIGEQAFLDCPAEITYSSGKKPSLEATMENATNRSKAQAESGKTPTKNEMLK